MFIKIFSNITECYQINVVTRDPAKKLKILLFVG